MELAERRGPEEAIVLLGPGKACTKSDLTTAVASGTAAEITAALDEHGNHHVHCLATSSSSMLAVAASNGLAAVKAVVEAGGTFLKDERRVPLFIALYKSDLAVASYLMEMGAKLEEISNTGETALDFAVSSGNVDTVRFVLEKSKVARGDVNGSCNRNDGREVPPLMSAIRARKPEIVEMLLDHGANPNCIGGRRPVVAVDFAVLVGSLDCVALLLRHPRFERSACVPTNPHDLMCRLAAMRSPCLPRVLHLMVAELGYSANGTGEFTSPLCVAAKVGQLSTVKTLVGLGARVDGEPGAHTTALFGAVGGGHMEVVRFLVEVALVNPHRRATDSGVTALHCAAMRGQASILYYLLSTCSRPEDLFVKTHVGDTVWMSACAAGNLDCLKELVNFVALQPRVSPEGRDIFDDKNRRGKTGIMQAIEGRIPEASLMWLLNNTRWAGMTSATSNLILFLALSRGDFLLAEWVCIHRRDCKCNVHTLDGLVGGKQPRDVTPLANLPQIRAVQVKYCGRPAEPRPQVPGVYVPPAAPGTGACHTVVRRRGLVAPARSSAGTTAGPGASAPAQVSPATRPVEQQRAIQAAITNRAGGRGGRVPVSSILSPAQVRSLNQQARRNQAPPATAPSTATATLVQQLSERVGSMREGLTRVTSTTSGRPAPVQGARAPATKRKRTASPGAGASTSAAEAAAALTDLHAGSDSPVIPVKQEATKVVDVEATDSDSDPEVTVVGFTGPRASMASAAVSKRHRAQ